MRIGTKAEFRDSGLVRMKKLYKIMVVGLMIMIMTGQSLYAEEEITDPEVLDRLEKMESRIQGLAQAPDEITAMIEEANDPISMPVDVMINGSYLKSDVEAMTINDRTYVPLRAICEAFNIMEIQWDDKYYKATVVSGDKELIFPINTYEIVVNEEPVEMDSPIVVVEGRTMVPVRFISEIFGFNVGWDDRYFTVNIDHESFPVNPDRLEDRFYTYEEVLVFSKLLMKEAGSVSYETKHGVASVVMNQLNLTDFADSIYGIIFFDNGTRHFPPVFKEDFLDTVPNYNCVLAVKKVLRGENSVGECIYFNTRPFKNKTVYKVVDGVYFCY